MTSAIHTPLVAKLKTVVDGNNVPIFKTIALWNNQPEHELQVENDQKPYLKPACFIEYTEIQAQAQNTQKKVQKQFRCVLHIVYELMKDNDIAFLDTKQQTYAKVQWFEASTCSKFQYQGETLPTDYPNLRMIEQIYQSVLTDFDAMTNPIANTIGTVQVSGTITNNI